MDSTRVVDWWLDVRSLVTALRDARASRIVGAAVLSTLATFALVGMQRHTQIDTEESFGKAFESNGLHWAASIVTTGEVLTMPITTLIGFMAQPRVQYAMARDGLLPRH